MCSAVFAELATKYSSSAIPAVTGILHSLVNFMILLKQKHTTLPNLRMSRRLLNLKMHDVALNRMSGAALCQMVRLTKDTLSEKKGQRGITSAGRDQMEIELDFLTHLKETDKSHLPAALRILDEIFIVLLTINIPFNKLKIFKKPLARLQKSPQGRGKFID